ncbi:MAG: hypothetical protein J07HQX50_01386 [Haloquadratum sp. J07HQX50]|nr:MAG: hypothetical protein J07HQX50_01386 [Haloquadratum sp. J07HQX50]
MRQPGQDYLLCALAVGLMAALIGLIAIFGSTAMGSVDAETMSPAQAEPGYEPAESAPPIIPQHVFSIISGQVAEEDGTVDTRGTALGEQRVLVVFVGERGQTVTHLIGVSDGRFDEENLPLGSISQGRVSGHVIATGRDGEVGDGVPLVDENDEADLTDLASYIGTLSGTGDQVRSQIRAETVDDDGSDDQMITETFRVTDSRTSIESVYNFENTTSNATEIAVSAPIVVTGQTNRQPADNLIIVEVLSPENETVQSAVVNQWRSNGQWSTTVNITTLDPGTYTLRADDGADTDEVAVEFIHKRSASTEGAGQSSETPAETTTLPTERTATGLERNASSTSQATTESSVETAQRVPGFDFPIAVVALLTTILLALRIEI